MMTHFSQLLFTLTAPADIAVPPRKEKVEHSPLERMFSQVTGEISISSENILLRIFL